MEARWRSKEAEMEARWRSSEAEMEASLETRWKVKEAEIETEIETKVEAKLETRWKVKEAVIKTDIEAEVEAKFKANLPAAIAASVRDLPYEVVCGYKGVFQTVPATIPYDRITSEFNNADRPGGADGQLDIESGVFTCLTNGYYTVAVTYQADMSHSSSITTNLYVNGVILRESHNYSYNQDSSAIMEEMVSRTIVSSTHVISMSSLLSVSDCPSGGRRHP